MTNVSGTLEIKTALICTLVSIVLGIGIAFIYSRQGNYTKNYIVTLALLPELVQVVIMLVNGKLGTGVAVMGDFSLVRFRSLPGTSKEIRGIFFAMVVGLATGMGYITYAAIITVVIGVAMFLFFHTSFGEVKDNGKMLKIVIPENLDYEGVFDQIFDEYTKE